tara:strand:- start:348 stop:758 length:411 start_codon:yes stop_codon:yes gene_type:complete
MALSRDKGTLQKNGNLLVLAVAAGAVIHGGAIVVIDAGFANKATTKVGLKFGGIAEEAINNTGGANGAKSIEVRRERLFFAKNSSGDPIAQADLFNQCYLEDDETVAKTNGGNTRSLAGRIMQVDSNGIWVEGELA